MMRFISFGSGSSGNCYYLESEGYGILIDIGMGKRLVKRALHDYGISAANIKAILVTHDHTDHVKSVGTFSTEFNIPVYASTPVHAGIHRNHFVTNKIPRGNIQFIETGTTITLGPLQITSFVVPHDSAGNNGYFITNQKGNSFCIATDIGHITEEIMQFASQAKYLVIEANYDETMLATGPYPEYLKKRIRSGQGHLSNKEVAESLAKCLTMETRRIWFCHLSEENNHPELARITIESIFRQSTDLLGKGLRLDILRRKVPSGFYDLE